MKDKLIITILLVSLTFCSLCAAQDLNRLTKSEYFSVYAHSDADLNLLLRKLKFDYFSRLESFRGSRNLGLPDQMLANTLDSLFLEVSDIIDIHVYSFHCNLEIYATQRGVSDAFKRYFNTSFKERSFYLQETNTIYISELDLTLGMLGHEIAHAIICHYFTPPPPTRMQEILAGYVEYNLRKDTNSLR